MIQTIVRNWWLLILCGVIYAVTSSIYFSHAEQGFTVKSMVMFLGQLTLAAGACTIVAGLWRSTKGRCWILVLNGFALSTLGLIFIGGFGFRISFRTIALLLAVIAMSSGVFELALARAQRRLRHTADEWFWKMAGAVSVGFALAFLAFVFRWIKLETGSPAQTLLWCGIYFGFSAVSLLGLILRLRSQGSFQVAVLS